MEKTFREKLVEAMIGHEIKEVALVLVDVLAAVLHEAKADVREKLIEEMCAEIARKAIR